MRRTGPTSIVTRRIIRELRRIASENKAAVWRRVAEELEKPRRQRRAVNISRINRYTVEGDIIVVPGKVLGAGNLDHTVTVAALGFTKTALEKITASGGKALSIQDLARSNPKGSGIKIVG